MSADAADPAVCRHISEQLPWYVNGTISEAERHCVDAHLLCCTRCRDDLAIDRLVYQEMRAETGVGYMPAPSLKKLQARLDTLESMSPADGRSGAPDQGATQWPKMLVASLAVMVFAISLLVGDRWMQFRASEAAPRYHTVTTVAPHAPGEVIRAVFSTTITLVELQSVLARANLRIVSGPTEAGVYSLAATSGQPVSFSLGILRADPRIRFAESLQSDALLSDSQ